MKFLDWFSARSRLTLALLTLGALLAIAIVTCTLALRTPEGSEQAAAQRDMMPRGTLLTLTNAPEPQPPEPQPYLPSDTEVLNTLLGVQ